MQSERRFVTAFFCDVAGSTALGERLDPEATSRLMSRYFAVVSESIERHGGRVEKFIGDAVVGVFGAPHSHEDDALRAIRAAVEARDGVGRLADDIRGALDVDFEVRFGLATGEVVIGDARGERVVTGDTMNTAARLETAASSGEILIAPLTFELARGAVEAEPAGHLVLKGKADPFEAFRLLGVHSGAPARALRLDGPMVGRDREARVLRDAFTAVVEQGESRFVTVLGPAGIGKSRLVSEAIAAIGDTATVAGGRCLSYGDGIAYWPLAEAVRGAVGTGPSANVLDDLAAVVGPVDDRDAIVTGVAALMGVEGMRSRIEESRVAVRRLAEVLARRRPLVLVFDDVHWAAPGFLELIEYLGRTLSGVPVMVVLMARPEVADTWDQLDRLPGATLTLEPLRDDAVAVLLANLTGGRAGGLEQDRLMTASAGNPLFLEELVGMLADDEAAESALPPTIQALLTTRLDRLDGGERAVVDRAAVEGQGFHEGAVVALGVDTGGVTDGVAGLTVKGIVQPRASVFPATRAHTFRHILIRDAAYAATAKQLRALWHEQLADWVVAMAGTQLSEYEEIVAHHLAQATRYRWEIGDAGPATDRLAARAAALYREAADRALVRGEFLTGATLLGPAAEMLPRDSRERAVALCDRAWNIRMSFDFAFALRVLNEAQDAARGCGAPALVDLVNVLGAAIRDAGGAENAAREIRSAIDRARDAAEGIEESDRQIAARLWMLVGVEEGYVFGRQVQAAAASGRAVEIAREIGETWLEETARWHLALHTIRGPGAIDDVLERGWRLIDGLGGAALANFHADRSDLDVARGDEAAALEAFQQAIEIGREFWPIDVLHHDWALGDLRARAGRYDEAIELFRSALAGAEELGAAGETVEIAGLLARALAMSGDPHGALSVIDAHRVRGSAVDADSVWLGAEALALAATGRQAEAAAYAHRLAEIAAQSDVSKERFDARIDAAEAYRMVGDRAVARDLLHVILEESLERGAFGDAEAARQALSRLNDPTD